MPTAPPIPAILIMVLALACTALLVAGSRYGLRRSSISAPQQSRTTRLFAAAFLAWFVVVGLLAREGFFSDFKAIPPRLLLAVLLPAFFLAVASFKSRLLAEVLRNVLSPGSSICRHFASWSKCFSGVATRPAPSPSR